MINKIVTHVENKYNENQFEGLDIRFFGGEPFLQFDVVEELMTRIRLMSVGKGFKLNLQFTTNGTLIGDRQIEFLKDFNPVFQITIDGNREQHNSVRIPKSGQPTYNTIINTINRLTNEEGIGYVIVRINFSAHTFDHLSSILDDLAPCNKRKMDIRLYKVWQEDSSLIDNTQIIHFIREAQLRKYQVEYISLYYNLCGCYADNDNEAVINYDGRVYKCTARDFTKDNAEGILMDDGTIAWNKVLIEKRKNTGIADFCINCTLLPSCSKICTQNLIEKQDQVGCVLNSGFSKEDIIIQNFNNQLIIYED